MAKGTSWRGTEPGPRSINMMYGVFLSSEKGGFASCAPIRKGVGSVLHSDKTV